MAVIDFDRLMGSQDVYIDGRGCFRVWCSGLASCFRRGIKFGRGTSG